MFPTVPRRVDYELTQLGATLLAPVSALADWALEHRRRIQGAREHFDATHTEAKVSA